MSTEPYCYGHEWIVIDRYKDTAGTHITYQCLNCGLLRLVHETPHF